MKALILAGGRGTRLRPLTHTTNKHLLPIGNTPMIVRVIKDAIDLGIKDIIININKGDTEMPALLGDGSNYDVKIRYIQQPEPNGMMYPIKLAQELIGDDEFLFSAGDNILAGGLKQHYSDFKRNNSDAHVLVVKRPDYQQFGVAVLENGKIIKTVEKPKEYISDLVLTAIYFFTPAVFKSFDFIQPIDPKGTGKPEYYPPVVNNWLIENGYTITASEVTGWWKDTGRPEDIISANQFVLDNYSTSEFTKASDIQYIGTNKIEGNIKINENSIIENSTLRGPIAIGKNVIIKNSYIGPYTSIGDNSIIENSRIDNSILMGGNKINCSTSRLDSSLIGWNAEVKEKTELPKETSLYIGDDSIVKL